MNLEAVLQTRSGAACELCLDSNDLVIYQVPPEESSAAEHHILVCTTCNAQLQKNEQLDPEHWKKLAHDTSAN